MERSHPRRAKLEAERRLFTQEEEEDQFEDEIQDDDYATLETLPNETIEYTDEGSIVEAHDDVLAEEDVHVAIDSDSSESGDEVEGNDVLTAPSGMTWTRRMEHNTTAGRIPERNVIRVKQGFKCGLNPATKREAFLITFDAIIDLVVHYTNLYGRRNYSEAWKNTSRIEMEAFLGIHILAGE